MKCLTMLFWGKVKDFFFGCHLLNTLSDISTVDLLSRIPRDSIKYFEISVPRYIRFAELKTKLFEQPHLTNIYVIGVLKLEIY